MRSFQYIKQCVLLGLLSLFTIQCSDDSEEVGMKPVADFEVSATDVEEHNSVTFTDLSTNTPTLWTWNFPGGNPTYSNQPSPTVIYDIPGVYPVTMTVRNEDGADEITKTDYITVTGKPIVFLSRYGLSGNLNDEGTNSITAVSTYGTPTYTQDKDGNDNGAWKCPEVAGQRLEVPEFKGIGADGARTVMAWFKTPAVGSRKTIVSFGKNIQGAMFNVMVQSGKIRVEAGSCSLFSTSTGLDNDKWHHIAVTFDPEDGDKLKDAKIYIDGILDVNRIDEAGGSYRSEVVVINTDITTNDVRIGDANYTDKYFFQGAISDVRILSSALIGEQIVAIMNGDK